MEINMHIVFMSDSDFDPSEEVSRVLTELADKVRRGYVGSTIRDSDGNEIGEFTSDHGRVRHGV
jgi:hypothetical protein